MLALTFFTVALALGAYHVWMRPDPTLDRYLAACDRVRAAERARTRRPE